MTPNEIRTVVSEVLSEQEARIAKLEHELVARAVAASLAAWGVDINDVQELRELKLDRVHNRKWRNSVERVEKVGIGAAVTVVVSGVLAALWMGFKLMVGKS